MASALPQAPIPRPVKSLSVEEIGAVADLAEIYLQEETHEFTEQSLLSALFNLYNLSCKKGAMSEEHARCVKAMAASAFGMAAGSRTANKAEPGGSAAKGNRFNFLHRGPLARVVKDRLEKKREKAKEEMTAGLEKLPSFKEMSAPACWKTWDSHPSPARAFVETLFSNKTFNYRKHPAKILSLFGEADAAGQAPIASLLQRQTFDFKKHLALLHEVASGTSGEAAKEAFAALDIIFSSQGFGAKGDFRLAGLLIHSVMDAPRGTSLPPEASEEFAARLFRVLGAYCAGHGFSSSSFPKERFAAYVKGQQQIFRSLPGLAANPGLQPKGIDDAKFHEAVRHFEEKDAGKRLAMLDCLKQAAKNRKFDFSMHFSQTYSLLGHISQKADAQTAVAAYKALSAIFRAQTERKEIKLTEKEAFDYAFSKKPRPFIPPESIFSFDQHFSTVDSLFRHILSATPPQVAFKAFEAFGTGPEQFGLKVPLSRHLIAQVKDQQALAEAFDALKWVCQYEPGKGRFGAFDVIFRRVVERTEAVGGSAAADAFRAINGSKAYYGDTLERDNLQVLPVIISCTKGVAVAGAIKGFLNASAYNAFFILSHTDKAKELFKYVNDNTEDRISGMALSALGLFMGVGSYDFFDDANFAKDYAEFANALGRATMGSNSTEEAFSAFQAYANVRRRPVIPLSATAFTKIKSDLLHIAEKTKGERSKQAFSALESFVYGASKKEFLARWEEFNADAFLAISDEIFARIKGQPALDACEQLGEYLLLPSFANFRQSRENQERLAKLLEVIFSRQEADRSLYTSHFLRFKASEDKTAPAALELLPGFFGSDKFVPERDFGMLDSFLTAIFTKTTGQNTATELKIALNAVHNEFTSDSLHLLNTDLARARGYG